MKKQMKNGYDAQPVGVRVRDNTITYNTGDIPFVLKTSPSPNPSVDSLNTHKQQIYRWYFQTIANPGTSDSTAKIAYSVDVTAKNTVGQELFLDLQNENLINYAEFSWNYLDHGAFSWAADDRKTVSTSVVNVVVQPRISITKSKVLPTGNTVSAGDTVRYSLNICNNSSTEPARAFNISVSDILPLGMRVTTPFNFVYSNINGGAPTVTTSYDSTSGVMRWSFSNADSLRPDSCMVITYSAKVDDDVLDKVDYGKALKNSAKVDTFYSNLPTASYRRAYAPQLATPISVYLGGIYITPDRESSVGAGATVLYQHIVANLGATKDTITFNIDTSKGQGWQWTIHQAESNGDAGAYIGTNGATMTLNAGQRDTIIVKAFVPTDTPFGTLDITKFTIVSAKDSDITSFVVDRTTVGGGGAGSLKLIKNVDKPEAVAGDTLTYTVTYINIGTETIYDVTLSDPVSEHVTIVDDVFGTPQTKEIEWILPNGTTTHLTKEADTDNATYDASIGIITIEFNKSGATTTLDHLAPGESGTLSYKVKIK